MDGNPVDEQLRPPDPPLQTENPTVHSKTHEVADSALSSSSQRREEAIQVATIEADIDASRHNVEKDYHLPSTEGAIESGEKQMGDDKIASQEAAAKSSSIPVQSSANRQESRTGESYLGRDSHSQQIAGAKDDSRHEVEKIVSQGRNRDGQNPQMNRSVQNQQRNPNFNKEKEIEQQRNPNSNKEKEIEQQNPRSNRFLASKDAAYTSQNRQSGILPSEIPNRAHNVQGNIVSTNFNSKNDELVNATDRTNTVSVRNPDYQHNFPKLTSNFDRTLPRTGNEKQDPPLGTNNFPKKDHIPEPAPYTVIQTYADRLRYNQSKRGENIKLTEPEITTKQGLPAVLYVKEEVVKDLASTCKFTLIGKFIYTMPRIELIRKNFILQTQLSGGVKIAHFNSRHVYIDLDNELDYNMVWTKQRMTIAGQVMRIQAWTPIWISLPELPWHCYNKQFITSLLSPIDLQITQNLDTGRSEMEHHQPLQQGVEAQQQGIQEEWQTQKRRNNNQQVRFNHERTVSHQQQSQTGMITIPTKNTYIDLESQDHTPVGDGIDQHNVYQHDQSHVYTEGTHVHKEKRNKQSRVDIQVTKDHQAYYQHDNQNTAGIDSMLPSPAIPYRDNVGVADGGEVGRCQVVTNSQHVNYDKGKNKVVEQGTSSNVEKEPPDKQTVNISDQFINKNNNKNQITTGNGPIDHQQDKNVDEYRPPDSEDEFDLDTQSLEEGMEPGEEFSTSDQIHKGPLLQSSNVDEIRDVTGKQGLSPRGRKLVKQTKITSTSKPNTRARSRGI
ncbi:hypothetical protein EJD97_019532 [Solanum chilense]|uniref:DUF4283 domain-containing protein n=1 Tax=Solanum chilense TaxID=4083 RepID=A0A6N2B6Y8_SOLCI|nr:hypothetical protein EJD97_019532 [Solanum chilense]